MNLAIRRLRYFGLEVANRVQQLFAGDQVRAKLAQEQEQQKQQQSGDRYDENVLQLDVDAESVRALGIIVTATAFSRGIRQIIAAPPGKRIATATARR